MRSILVLAVTLCIAISGLMILNTSSQNENISIIENVMQDPSPTRFSGGDGSAGNPYKISNVTELQWMGNATNLNKYFILSKDIDASATKTWNSGAGFMPVGTSSDGFMGSFNGKGFNITVLFINRSATDYIGLFGHIGPVGKVSNVKLINYSATGHAYVGGLVGYNNCSFVSNCSGIGSTTGLYAVGGLVGENYMGSVSNCSFIGNTEGDSIVGGFMGDNFQGLVTNCLAMGNTNGTTDIGGFIGDNFQGSVSNCSVNGNTTGFSYVGGLVGQNYQGSVINCSSMGNANGTIGIGGLVGYNNRGSVSNSHYNIDTVLINGENHLTLGGIFNLQYMDWLDHGKMLNILDYNTNLVPYNGYYNISNISGLRDVLGFTDCLGYRFKLTADIDMSSALNLNIPYFAAKEFDGNGHLLTNLSLAHTFKEYNGFFEIVCTGSTITNICIINSTISGNRYIGGMVGKNFGLFNNCSILGSFTGVGTVGGFVGSNDGSVHNCSALGNTTGTNGVGGFVGFNDGSIFNSYAMGNVTRSSGTGIYIAGFVGFNNYIGKIVDCYSTNRVYYYGTTNPTDKGFAGIDVFGIMTGNYWDRQTSGQTSTAGNAIGKTTTEMMTLSTFASAGWDIAILKNHVAETWYIDEGSNYPRLGWEKYNDHSYNDKLSPLADAGPNQTIDMGGVVAFNGYGSRDNVRITNYTWTFNDNVLVTLFGAGPNHRFDNAGSYCVILNVTDPVSNWDIDTMTVTVNDTRDPTANAGPDKTVDMGDIVAFNGSGSIDNVGIVKYNWSFTDGGLVNLLDIGPTHRFDDAGVFVVTLNVSDAAGNWDVDTMTVTVNDTQAPIADAGPDRTVNMEESVTFNGSRSSDNVGIINYTWTFDDGGLVNLYGLGPKYQFDAPGIFHVIMNVTDAAGNWAVDIMKVTVNDTRAPVATLLSPVNNTEVYFQNPTLQWTVSDEDKDNVTCDVYLGKVKEGIQSLDSSNKVATSMRSTVFTSSNNLDKGATYYWTVIPFNGKNYGKCLNGIWSFKVSENASVNLLPVFQSTPSLEAGVGQKWSYTPLVTDEDKDTITINLVTGPIGMDFKTETFTWTPTESQLGNNNVIISASDGKGSTQQSFVVVVTKEGPSNHAPTITPIPDKTNTEGDLVSITVLATDLDSDTLTYSLGDHPANMSISASGIITWQTKSGDAGEYTSIVKVSDGKLTTTASFKITVNKKTISDDDDVSDDDTSSNLGLVIAGIVAAVVILLIIVGIVVFLMMRKKKQEPAAQQAPGTPIGPAPEGQTPVQPAPTLEQQPGAQPATTPPEVPLQPAAQPTDQAMAPAQDPSAQPGMQAEAQAQPGMDMTQAQQTGMQPVMCSVCGQPTQNYPGQGNWCTTCQRYA